MAELAPEHPSMWTLLGSPDEEILKVAEQVYRGQLAVVPSVLPTKNRTGAWGSCTENLPDHGQGRSTE